jgi:hypothetical protein
MMHQLVHAAVVIVVQAGQPTTINIVADLLLADRASVGFG